jgi:hypothetical protein
MLASEILRRVLPQATGDGVDVADILLTDPLLGSPVALKCAAPIDATTTPTVQLGRAYPGKLFIPVSILFAGLTKAGTLTTQPLCKIGNTAGSDNITSSSILCTTAQFALAFPSQSRNTPITPSVLVDMTTPLSLVVTTPGAGAGLTLTAVAGVIGFLIDA